MSEKMCECKTCKQQIARNAKVCPHCGAKNKKANPVLIGIIVAVVLIVIISSAGGDNEPVKVGDYTAQPSTSAVDSQSGTQPATTEAVSQDENTFTVGEIAELRDVQVSLVSVTENTGSSFNKPNEGNVFVLCEFEIANNSEEEIAVSSMLSFEAYCDDYACSFSLGALIEKGNKNQLDGTVAAGKKFNGVIGYEVPADWAELEIRFTPDFWSGKDIIFTATNA